MPLTSKLSWCYTHVMWYRSIARKPCDACEEEQISKLSLLKSTSSVDKMAKWVLCNQICAAVTAIVNENVSSVKKNKKGTHACIVEPSRSNDCHHRKGEVTPLTPLPPHTWGRFLQKYQAVQMGQEAKVTPSPMKKIIRNTFFCFNLTSASRTMEGSP